MTWDFKPGFPMKLLSLGKAVKKSEIMKSFYLEIFCIVISD